MLNILLNRELISIKKNKTYFTPLFTACKNGHINIVKYLIEEGGVDIEEENGYGMTPLFCVCNYGKEKYSKIFS